MKIIHKIKNSKQFQNFSIYGIGQLFNLLTPLLVAPYVIIICGEEGFGKAGIGLSFVFILTVLVDFASGINGVKDVSVYREELKKVQKIANTLFSIKLFALLFILLLASGFIVFVPFLNQEKELYFLSLVFLVSQAFNPTWFLQGIEKFKIISFVSSTGKRMYIVLVLLLVTKKEDYIFVNFYFGISALFVHLIGMGWLIRNKFLVLKKPAKADVLSIFSRDYKLTLSQLLLSLQQYSPILIVGFFGNSSLAGQYKIIDQIIVIFKTYLLLFFNYVYPRICYLLEKSKKEALHFWKLYNGVNFIFITFSMIGIAFFSLKVVAYFNPQEVEVIADLLKIAVFIPILQAISIPLKQLVLGTNKQKVYVRTTMVITSVSLVMIVLITPFYKVFGVLLALIITEIVTMLIYYATIKNNLFGRSH